MNTHNTSILITGGTGNLGGFLVPRLVGAHGPVRVVSRSKHESTDNVEFTVGNVSTGQGLENALNGIETIVHLAGSNKGDEAKTANLVQAAQHTGAKHLVYISVVGADRIPVESAIDRAMFGYVAAKRASEEIIAESGIPWTTLRATQFHELIFAMAQGMTKMPVVPVPSLLAQPIGASDVADRLIELAIGEPLGLVPEIGGPKVYELRDLIGSYMKAVGKERPMLSIRLPGKAAAAYRAGANLTPDRAVGEQTWEEFLKTVTPR
ncbi:MAG: NAD(P)H-binding protein [Acidimicrobiia bacterium]|nr:NAD(P)H-binding protein [Acidimicrobiia bacterium]